MEKELLSTAPDKVLKYCPFCGSTEFRNISRSSFFCDHCHKEYFINTAAAVAAIIKDNNGKILFARRAKAPFKGTLDLPGGFANPGETAEEALQRELYEELGSKPSSFQYFCSFPNEYPYSGLCYFTLDLAYICQFENLTHLKAMDDVASIEFINPATVNFEEIRSVSMRNIIRTYLKYLNNNIK